MEESAWKPTFPYSWKATKPIFSKIVYLFKTVFIYILNIIKKLISHITKYCPLLAANLQKLTCLVFAGYCIIFQVTTNAQDA